MESIKINPKYEGKCTIGFGALQITDFSLPHDGFDPLAKFWASIRRHNRREYGVEVTGIFIYDQTDSVISCSFCLDYGYQLTNDIDRTVYEQRFMDTFEAQMGTLKNAIKEFILDTENGYQSYLEHIKQNGEKANEAYCNEMFNRFLRSVGLKKPEDEKRKREFQAKFAKAFKNTMPLMFNL